MARGFFITFEGGEGAGKSTQIRLLADKLRAKKYPTLATREPGGSPGAEAVRQVLLSGAAERFGPEMEALLFGAARSDHVEQLMRPAVEAGAIVLCDRYIDSSRVYQGVTGNLEPQLMESIERVAINGFMPDLTLIFDIDPAIGLRRAHARRSPDALPDRFEKEALDIHIARRNAFLDIARREPRRCRVIEAGRDMRTVEDDVTDVVFEALAARSQDAAAQDGAL